MKLSIRIIILTQTELAVLPALSLHEAEHKYVKLPFKAVLVVS